ncbi:MAG: sulfotransferase family 2 domain-containing protein [Cyanobacteria bacterium P01_D01_bin.50]
MKKNILVKLKPIKLNITKKLKQSRYRFHKLQGKSTVHFLHIGKTGGTAIKTALAPTPIVNSYVIYLHGHKVNLRDIPKGEKVIFFLRDPISRFISGFYSRKRQGRPKYNVQWSPEEEIVFKQFETPRELAVSISSSDKSMRESAINAMKSIKHVNNSYWDWFDTEEYFFSRLSDFLFIGFQETLEQDFIVLKKILKLPENIQLPNDSFAAHKNPSNVDTYLDDIAKSNLSQWYARDYKFLDLCKNISQKWHC